MPIGQERQASTPAAQHRIAAILGNSRLGSIHVQPRVGLMPAEQHGQTVSGKGSRPHGAARPGPTK
jgi:hypothetical protein